MLSIKCIISRSNTEHVGTQQTADLYTHLVHLWQTWSHQDGCPLRIWVCLRDNSSCQNFLHHAHHLCKHRDFFSEGSRYFLGQQIYQRQISLIVSTVLHNLNTSQIKFWFLKVRNDVKSHTHRIIVRHFQINLASV